MKRLLILSATSLVATTAFAADAIVYQPVEEVEVVAIPDTFSWTGGYIGVNAGYAGGKFKHPASLYHGEFEQTLNGSADVTASGFAGGVQAGYNWQFDNNVIAGIEADFQGSNLKGEVKGRIDVPNQFDASAKAGTKVDWFGSLRARLGYTPVDRFMVYATGGYAYGKVKSHASYSIDGIGEGISKSKTKSGWTVGAGAEYAINTNWTLKTEYLYTDLGKTKLFNASNDFVGAKLDAKVKFHTVRAGINYKF